MEFFGVEMESSFLAVNPRAESDCTCKFCQFFCGLTTVTPNPDEPVKVVKPNAIRVK